MSITVSVIIPTYNAGRFLSACLESIEKQDIGRESIELIIVDAGSEDGSIDRVQDRVDRVLVETPPAFEKGEFGAPWQRARGAAVASGEYLYYFDADMRMPTGLLSELVSLAGMSTVGAIVVPEHSIGQGIWAAAKGLERDFYFGTKVEAARFVRSSVWREVGGLDFGMGPCDDWDLHSRVLSAGYRVERASGIVLHDEGTPSLTQLAAKRFRYGKELHKAIAKRGATTTAKYFSPTGRGYSGLLREARSRPLVCGAFVLMRLTEYGSGGAGLLVGLGWESRKSSGSRRSSGRGA